MSEFPLPPLAALRAFEAAARRGRFSSAAEELHVSQSAVSHHVRHLEEYLHVRLFERAGVGMKLTEAGARFFAEIYPALERIRRATGEFRAQGARRRVTLTTLPSVVNTWLIPHWTSFEQRCPDIDLQLLTATRVIDLEREQVDLALRFGDYSDSGVVTRWLFAEQLIPVCAPAYLSEELFGNPSRLMRHVRLIVNGTDPDEWNQWCEAECLPQPDLSRALHFAEGQEVLRAAENGLGLAIGRRPVVDIPLRMGSLVAPLGVTELDGHGCYLCYPARREPGTHVMRVTEWLETVVTELSPIEELIS
ncbi:MAG: LysR substrate-binding domain-containing protein [Gammaproteobacteria bacterium]|nr:LysR substrate-binding domain-containing protein [Gammaproteobacteria bacterium]